MRRSIGRVKRRAATAGSDLDLYAVTHDAARGHLGREVAGVPVEVSFGSLAQWRALVEAERPLWSYMSFDAAHENFTSAARSGLDATLYWPGTGWIHPDELVLRKLLPMAAEGLARWGVAPEVCDRYLPVIERRCLTRRTGASWQVAAVEALEDGGASRTAALHGMFTRYLEHSAANEPVHSWPLPR